MSKEPFIFIPEPDVVLGDKFRLVERLGRGGFGEVWKACRLADGELIALKIPRDQELGEEALRREPDTQKSIHHPNVVQVYNSHIIGGLFLIEMELVQGRSLDKVLEVVGREHPLSFEQMLTWADQILDGLGAAHAHAVVHGDIKPQNILIGNDGIAKLVDFGTSRKMEHEFITTQGEGTPRYMAPEVAFGGKRGYVSDLYSLGVVLYEMVTGVDYPHPFQILSGERPAKPREHNRRTPIALEQVILKAIEPKPEDRYHTCQEMLFAIREIEEQLRHQVAPREIGRDEPSKFVFRPDSSSPLYYLEQAKKLIAQGDDQHALEAAEIAVERSGGNPNYLRMLGGICLRLGYTSKAVETYEKLLTIYEHGYVTDPSQLEDVLELLGDLYIQTKRYGKAVHAYQQLRAVAKKPIYAQFKLAIANGLDGKYAEAICLLEELRDTRPDAVIIYSKLGWAYMAEGNFQQAISFYNQALVLNPTDLFSLFELGRYYLIQGDQQRAQGYFDRVLKNDKTGLYKAKVNELVEIG